MSRKKWNGLDDYYSMETQKIDLFAKKLEIEF